MRTSLVIFPQVLVGNLAKPAQHMPVVEFVLLEIARLNATALGMTDSSTALRCLDCDRGLACNALPATRALSTKPSAKATKWMISAIDARFARLPAATRPALHAVPPGLSTRVP